MDVTKFIADAKLEGDHEVWAVANWDRLLKIYEHYKNSVFEYEKAAEYVTSRIRQFDRVHSVKWRVKDPLHLLKKIIRKNVDF